MFSRFVGVIAAKKAKKRWDPTEERKLKININFFKFS